MAKKINISDLYTVKEDRFKQTKTYQTTEELTDPRWMLVESPSQEEIFFVDSFDSDEINLGPKPFIIIAGSVRIELYGEVVKQRHFVGTRNVSDGYDYVKEVVPVLDYKGQIERYETKYNYDHKSHFEQEDYMMYTVSYPCSQANLVLIATSSKIECMLREEELSSKDCKAIHVGAKVICHLLGDTTCTEDLKKYVASRNKRVATKEVAEQKKAAEQQRIIQERQNIISKYEGYCKNLAIGSIVSFIYAVFSFVLDLVYESAPTASLVASILSFVIVLISHFLKKYVFKRYNIDLGNGHILLLFVYGYSVLVSYVVVWALGN